eukprot:SAG11_NODE_2203_length_3670_cov_62.164395_4_plen_213_part_00
MAPAGPSRRSTTFSRRTVATVRPSRPDRPTASPGRPHSAIGRRAQREPARLRVDTFATVRHGALRCALLCSRSRRPRESRERVPGVRPAAPGAPAPRRPPPPTAACAPRAHVRCGCRPPARAQVLVQAIITGCVEGELRVATNNLQRLWETGYSAQDIITTIFRLTKVRRHSHPIRLIGRRSSRGSPPVWCRDRRATNRSSRRFRSTSRWSS